MKRLTAPLLGAWLVLLLAGCGYHLVGHGGGRGALPADVTAVAISGNGDAELLRGLRQRLADDVAVVAAGDAVDPAHVATLFVQMTPVSFAPSAYSASGVATQYRMTFAGQMTLTRDGRELWQSGNIQRQGDVYVTTIDPTTIEASRTRLLRDLRKAWLDDAMARLRSGF